MSLSKAALTVDSFQLFLNDCLPKLRQMEEMLSIIGIFFVGKLLLSTLLDISRGIRTHFISRLFRKNLKETYGKWAVVTGCTDGIGKAYMEELAKEGMNIVLISRNLTKLNNVAAEITQKYNIETEIVQADFLEGREVYERIEKALENKEIGMLVNNVGVMLDKPKMFHNARDDEVWGHINVNVATVPVLMKMVLPSMVSRKKGAIVNVASLAAIQPLPYMSIYSASKVFVEYLSESCKMEYDSTGITIQTLIPSYVSTKMLGFTDKFSISPLMVPSAQTFASSALNTLGYSSITTGYWPHSLQRWVISHFTTRWMYMQSGKLLNKFLSPEKIHLD